MTEDLAAYGAKRGGMKAERKLVEIDVMRGVAILMVVLVHTSQHVSLGAGRLALLAAYGQMGVQLFFVASAFTLCNSWTSRSSESQPALKYAIRRFFRIAPLYYFGLFFFMVVSAARRYFASGAFIPDEQYTTTNVLANIFLLNGFVPDDNNNIVPGGWSIGTEVAFYCMFPLLFAAARSLSNPRAVVVGLIGVLAASLGASALVCAAYGLQLYNNGFVYFNIATQLPVFAVGIAMFLLVELWPVKSSIANGAAFVVITSLCMVVFKRTQGPLFYAVPFMAAISFVFLFHFLRRSNFLLVPGLARVGRLSYSMYLFHSLFAVNVSSRVAPILERHIPGWAALVCCYAVAVAGTIFVAVLSERLLERRSIAAGRWLIRQIGSAAKPARSVA